MRGQQVASDWEAEDIEEEAKKASAAAAAKAKAEAEAEAAANHKTKTQRIAEREAAKAAQKAAEEDEETSSEEEDEKTRRDRLRKTEQESDLKHAEDLFGGLGVQKRTAKVVVTADPNNPGAAIDLSALPLFKPRTKAQFVNLRETMVPILTASSKETQYALFLPEFCKALAKDLPSEQIKKVASALTTLGNEKMKEEKSAEKTGKSKKNAKTKLAVGRDTAVKADVTNYGDEDFGE